MDEAACYHNEWNIALPRARALCCVLTSDQLNDDSSAAVSMVCADDDDDDDDDADAFALHTKWFGGWDGLCVAAVQPYRTFVAEHDADAYPSRQLTGSDSDIVRVQVCAWV